MLDGNGSIRYIIAKGSTDILKIKRIEEYKCNAGIEGKDILHIFVSNSYYDYEQIKAYITNNDMSEIEMHFSISVAPDTYETQEKSVLCEVYTGYTKELDINYDTESRCFCIVLQKETIASLNARKCKEQSLEAQTSLIELIEGGIV